MGLRCSLLGHDYGDSEVEREREEQGNEVVVTIRAEQTCTRCGKTKLVSENKEVTAITGPTEGEQSDPDTPADASPPVDDGEAADAVEATASDALDEEREDTDERDSVTGDGHDAEFVDEGPDEGDVPPATRAAGTVTEADEEQDVDPETDDAVIIDGDDDDPEPTRERGHGEWPDSDDQRSANEPEASAEWPSVEGEDEGFDADTGSGKPEDVEFGGGLAPEATASTDANARDAEAVVERPDRQPETTFTSVDSAPTPVESTGSDDASEYVCPECDFTSPGLGGSLRVGDICPECRRGYLAEQ